MPPELHVWKQLRTRSTLGQLAERVGSETLSEKAKGHASPHAFNLSALEDVFVRHERENKRRTAIKEMKNEYRLMLPQQWL